MSELHCLRCKAVPLAEVGPSDPRIALFECPACGRGYALSPGQRLTFRWGHPISLALYGVQFDESPRGRAAEVAAALDRERPTEEMNLLAREIRLELDEPTQQVRDILHCRASEDALREFLRLVADGIEASLASRRSRSQDPA